MKWGKDCANMLYISLMVYMLVGSFYDAAYFDLFYQIVAIVAISKDLMHRTLNHMYSNGKSINEEELISAF
jgi:hypothetical protein